MTAKLRHWDCTCWECRVGEAEKQGQTLPDDAACDLCGAIDDLDGGRLYVDRYPDTNRIRGVLCLTCLEGLARFEQDPLRLVDAASYVRRRSPPALTEERVRVSRRYNGQKRRVSSGVSALVPYITYSDRVPRMTDSAPHLADMQNSATPVTPPVASADTIDLDVDGKGLKRLG